MNAEQAWQATLGQLRMDMSKAAYDTWVRDAEMVACDDQRVTIATPNAYARDWLENRLSTQIHRTLSGIMNRSMQVEFIIRQAEPEAPEPAASLEPDPPAISSPAEFRLTNQTINGKYTFENFVVGPSNRLAHAACMAVAERPAAAYNPLFLYGGVGLGKTHLLHAIGNACLARGLQILYVSSESFTNDLIHAIRTQSTQAFRERYRSIDILLIDDVQFIAGKESTQEEFFHTFNTLHTQDKQIVLSSDRPPKAMVTLEERLRSRFEWGLTADLQPPDLETRMAILRSKAERAGRAVAGEIIETIARQVQSNIRELEGALIRVMAFADLSGLPLTPGLVNSALADLLPQRSDVSPELVIKAVADAFNVTTEKVLGRDRSREVALPRQVAMYLLREEGNISLPQIGDLLGGRDHTTVMYACEKVADQIERDDRLRRQVLSIRQRLYGRA